VVPPCHSPGLEKEEHAFLVCIFPPPPPIQRLALIELINTIVEHLYVVT